MPAITDSAVGTALVTGAGYGLGAATAEHLARDGFDLVVTDLELGMLTDTVAAIEALGRRVLAFALDVRSVPQMDDVIAASLDTSGVLDVLVNNAGVPLSRPALEVEPEEFDNLMAINVRGAYFMAQRFARRLVSAGREGCVINIASTFSVIGVPGVSVYGLSKGAVAGMTRHLAAEWAQYGIRVNAVAPGAVETPLRAAHFAAHPDWRAWNLERIPLGRFGAEADTAAAVAYLASPGARYVNGHLLVVDGGLTVT